MKIETHTKGSSKVICLIGNPVEHSISPQLHNTLSLMTNSDLTYVPFKVEDKALGKAVEGLKALNVRGFNITIPYKQDVIKYLDEVRGDANVFGAVNTVLNENGKLIGYNTDGDGFVRAFEKETGRNFKDAEVVILGAGGAARGIALKICSQKPKKIYIINRTIEKAEKLLESLGKISDTIIDVREPSDYCVKQILENADIIINTTSCGMHPNIDSSPINDDVHFRSNQIVYDIIYNPAVTKLMKTAAKAGCTTINGLGMLLWQGMIAYEIWTGIQLDEGLASDIIRNMKNIL